MSGDATNFALNHDHTEFRRTVRSFFEAKADEAAVRSQLEPPVGYDAQVWHQMSGQLGLTGLAIPEELGGQGFTFVELGIVTEELGRCLLPTPYFASVVLAASLLMHAGDDAMQERYLPGIAAGSTVATVAVVEESGRWHPDSIQAPAHGDGNRWVLDGVKTYVLDGCSADLIFVAARSGDDISLFAVHEFDTVVRRPLSTLDPTRKQAHIEFHATPAELIGRQGDGWPVLARTLALGASALAAEQVGGAQRCLEMAVDYAKVRRQFGKPIGSFQAIRHKCADIYLDVECARGSAYYALRAAAALSEELPAASSMAKACSSEAYARAAAANIHIHGGIGFTWEHPAHLYFKRARSSGHLLGDAAFHRGLLADLIGI